MRRSCWPTRRAVQAKAAEVACEVDGEPWVQQPFPYQAKCLGWLRDSHAALPGGARAAVDPLLEKAGLSALFA